MPSYPSTHTAPAAGGRPLRVYLAGPFFNPAQVELIAAIETALYVNRVEHYSPRHHGDNEPAKAGGITNEMARRIFASNVQEICSCTHVLAVLDWQLQREPIEHELRLVERRWYSKQSGRDGESYLNPISGPLNLPDTGTVFEMGYAAALAIPIIGFTARPPTAALNVMLTQACTGVVGGLEGLADLFAGGRFNWEHCRLWAGRNQ